MEIHLDFSLWPPSVDLVYVSRNNFTCLSVLPALRFRDLFCVHHSDLNRIIKLSNIFPSLLLHASVLLKKEEEKITLS